MHTLAYDAGKIIASNIANGYNKEEFLSRLKSSEKFAGLSGKVSFVDSIAQREYEVIRKQNGTYAVQDNNSRVAIEEVLSTPSK
jgi:hypothetical protein